MKIEKIVVATLVTGMLTFSCNNTESVEGENTENAPETEINDDAENNEADQENEETESSNVETVELEDKTYAVEEFVNTYNDNAKGVKGQTVTIEGYYMNHNKQKAANSDDEYEYNVTLYKDETFERKGDRVFFMMKSKEADQFKGIKQKDKITVTGVISGEEFFGAPRLNEGEVVK